LPLLFLELLQTGQQMPVTIVHAIVTLSDLFVYTMKTL